MRHVKHVPGLLNCELEERFSRSLSARSFRVRKSSTLHIVLSANSADRSERDINQVLNPLSNNAGASSNFNVSVHEPLTFSN